MNASEVIVAEKRMFSEDCFKTHGLCSHQYDVLKNAYALVAMHYFNLLTDQYLSNQRQRVEKRHESNIAITHWFVRNMIYFHSISHIPNSTPSALELISDKCYFMTSLY